MTRRTLGVAVLVAAVLAAAPGTDYKIDKSLWNTLTDSEDATAPFWVVFSERADVKPAHRIAGKGARGTYVIRALQNVANRSQAGVRGYLRGQGVNFTAFWVENKIYVPQGSLELAQALAQRNEVAAVLPEVVYQLPQPQAGGGGSIQSIGWGVSKIRAPQVWSGVAPTSTGTGIVVANNDTGVQYNHPALDSHYRGNNGASYTHLGNWKDPAGACGPAGSPPCDNNNHGTHTMGTMVGDDGAGNQIGVAPGAKWIACKGCRTSSCLSSDLTACFQWFLDPNGDGQGDDQPDVHNDSWGGGGGSSFYQSYIDNLRAAGVFPAFSIGNSGPNCDTAGSPGDLPSSFGSGATDSGDVIASFSSRGPSLFGGIIKPDVTAPGSSVYSSITGNTYAYFSGTSMASPHTGGAVALLWGAVPSYRGNIAGTEALLRQSAVKLVSATQNCGGVATGASPNNVYGYGRLDVRAAVDLAAGTPVNQPPTVTITGPANGYSADCPATVGFAGTASDPPSTDLTSSIAWTDNSAGFGSGGAPSRSYTCTEAGNHTIVASVTDSGGATDTDTITITIVNPNVPAAPTELKATVSGSTVTLTWKDNSGAMETGFRVERRKKGGVWGLLHNKPANATSDTDTPGKGNWEYSVFAVNGSVDSGRSNVVTARLR